MKISMWIIYDELKKYGALPIIYEGDRRISSFRTFLFSNSSEAFDDGDTYNHAEYLYIGDGKDFFQVQQTTVLLANRNDMIILENVEIDLVINKIVSIFDKYNGFDYSLRIAATAPNPFQAVMDAVHGYFLSPMFFGHKSFQIYAITKQYPEAAVYEGWDAVKETMSMFPRINIMKEAPNMEKYPDSVDPAVIPNVPNTGERSMFRYQIRVNIKFKGHIWGHFYVYYRDSSISPGVLQIARYVGDVYERLLDSASIKESIKFEKYGPLIDFLNGNEIVPEKWESLKKTLSMQEDIPMVMFKIDVDVSKQTSMFYDYALARVAEKFHSSTVFSMGLSIILLLDAEQNSLDSIISQIQNTISYDNYCCGISLPFCELEDSREALFQANYAIANRIGNEKICKFEENGFDGFAAYIHQMCNWRGFINPSLRKIMDYDRLNSTDYARTLRATILNNNHYQKAADSLFIHKNTLKYRLTKIQELFGVDIDDGETSAYLRLSFAILANELQKD